MHQTDSTRHGAVISQTPQKKPHHRYSGGQWQHQRDPAKVPGEVNPTDPQDGQRGKILRHGLKDQGILLGDGVERVGHRPAQAERQGRHCQQQNAPVGVIVPQEQQENVDENDAHCQECTSRQRGFGRCGQGLAVVSGDLVVACHLG